ncbi:transmembrane protein, putative [Bodo saltans]|uniref:Transmembrane protein, putative n=1 Tax=Bodo saltans TaxID=75058 RepID=A0A0S4JHE9_BODSA|nr:transmembrane protein, putative [Bodo saltans]|eukprot:CUG87822.1 transmembrane protein, putative [Bodo saltans]
MKSAEVPDYVPQESTDIKDLIQSGRYKVAKPETIDMLKQISGPQQSNIMYPDSEVRDMKQYIIEQEGLDIGVQRRQVLAQQWRFFLSCEPIQRGLDAGIIFGCVAAALVAWRRPKQRLPHVIGLTWLGGFCTGVVSVPMMVVFADSYNTKRIKKMETEIFSRQREDFYRK